MDIKEYLSRIKSAESGGNRFAVNKGKDQTASGLYQFTKSTWEGLGYNWADRFNAEKQEEAVSKFTQMNIDGLKKAGVKEPTYSDLYGAHFLGLDGYKQLLSKADDTPVNAFIKDSTIKVNPNMLFDPKTGRSYTVGEVKNKLASKVKEKPTNTKTEIPTDTKLDLNNFRPEESFEIPNIPTTPNSVEDTAMDKLNTESYKRDLVDTELETLRQEQQQIISQQPQSRPQQIQNITPVQARAIEYTPLYQDGGLIPISSRGLYDYPNQQVIVPTNGSITMENINYPIIAESLETKEKQILKPNQKYFFKNTKTVLETPLK